MKKKQVKEPDQAQIPKTASSFISRRSFLAACAATSASCFTGLSLSSCSGESKKNDAMVSGNTQDTTQYGFWMDSSSCMGCGSCVEICREKSSTPEDEVGRRRIVSYTFEDGSKRLVSFACMHCAHPACLEVCPAGAIQKRSADGIVIVDQSLCIGCRYCQQACPFSIPQYTSAGMDKCDCCLGNGVISGNTPHCVCACPSGALHYGTLEKLATQVADNTSQINAPTGPSFYLS